MSDFEVHLTLEGHTRRIGRARCNRARGKETVLFEYDDAWLAFNVLVSNVDDHLRNHGFLRLGHAGWTLSPAYDLNPVPTDLKARVLSTRIDLVDATCSLDLLEEAAGYFALPLAKARTIIKEVATATAQWRSVAREVGAQSAEIHRMASAFEHDELRRALALP